MKLPVIEGIIDRRILINYHADPKVVRRYLPHPFEPQLVQGRAIVGICLIRLKNLRPFRTPSLLGIQSENAAHRIAVNWKTPQGQQSGVYIPRRDTSSRWSALLGGTLFPGQHHLAEFDVLEENGNYAVSFQSQDGTHLAIQASQTTEWNSESIFDSLASASHFFEKGCQGYSPGHAGFDGLELRTAKWECTLLNVACVRSGFFEDTSVFPEGSIHFDHALLMQDIPHQWHAMGAIPS